MSETTEEFVAAVAKSKSLPAQGNDRLLELYSLYKQSTEGDVSGKRPGRLDIKGRAKFDAWAKIKGMARPDAQQKYIDLVNRLAI